MDKETKIEMLNQLLENLDGAIDETIETFENDFFAEGMDQNDVAGALNALKDEIQSGKHDDALRDAYDRIPKRKKKKEATEEAE